MIKKTAPQGVLDYTYDAHGNLTNTYSHNTNGTNVTYAYDALNRLTTVTDTHRAQNLITSYTYDSIGNLSTITKPNGEAVTYVYDTLNRLTDITAKVGTNTIANYHYTLGAAGNRTNVSELNGRNVQYTYDDLYRLSGEIITNDPVVANIGAVNYTYDNVGNRQVRTSGIAAVPSQNFSGQYDSDDRLNASGYVYDANGSTTNDPNGTYVYDTLGRMTQATVSGNTTNYLYDGDGNKVSQTFVSTTTNYLVDSNNPTGYAQVLEETDSTNTVNKVFTFGISRISQDQLISSNWTLSFFGMDGQGSIRYLTDINGTITDRMDYDAFGILINRTGTTPNEIFYDGEQLDANTGFYNLRARWMNPAIGRFQTMDEFEGDQVDPLSIHKYLFTKNDSVNLVDPTGFQADVASLGIETAIGSILSVEPLVRAPQSPGAGSGPIVTLFLRSFAPWYVFGIAFGGDNRSFTTSTYPTVTSRLIDVITYKSGTNQIISAYAYSSGSTLFHFIRAKAQPTLSAYFSGSELLLDSTASDPFFFGAAPDIKVHLKLNSQMDNDQKGISYKGQLTGSEFPNAEVFVRIKNKSTMLLTYDTGLEYVPTAGVWSPFIALFGDGYNLGKIDKDVRF